MEDLLLPFRRMNIPTSTSSNSTKDISRTVNRSQDIYDNNKSKDFSFLNHKITTHSFLTPFLTPSPNM